MKIRNLKLSPILFTKFNDKVLKTETVIMKYMRIFVKWIFFLKLVKITLEILKLV